MTCVCDPAEWDGTPTPICGKFRRDPALPSICLMCEHDEECHSKVADEHLAAHVEAMHKLATEDPPGCPVCGAMAGACAEYPNCPGHVQELERKLEELGDIPIEVMDAAHRQAEAGGDAQLLAEFVLELGVRT